MCVGKVKQIIIHHFLQFNDYQWKKYNTPFLFQNRLRHQNFREFFLKSDYDLTCAHLEIPTKYSGCIFNYINPVKCPFSNK